MEPMNSDITEPGAAENGVRSDTRAAPSLLDVIECADLNLVDRRCLRRLNGTDVVGAFAVQLPQRLAEMPHRCPLNCLTTIRVNASEAQYVIFSV